MSCTAKRVLPRAGLCARSHQASSSRTRNMAERRSRHPGARCLFPVRCRSIQRSRAPSFQGYENCSTYFKSVSPERLSPARERTAGNADPSGDPPPDSAPGGAAAPASAASRSPASRVRHTKQQYFCHQGVGRASIVSGVLRLASWGCCRASEACMAVTMAASNTSLRFFCVRAEHSM